MQYKILVVLYNKKITESETCLSILSCRNLILNKCEVLIWDNSNSFNEDERTLFENELEGVAISFWGDGNNYPLSYIYNFVIKKVDNKGLLVIFDHDSLISSGYFEELFTLDCLYPDVNLFLPQIYYRNQLVSPAKLYYFIGRYFSKTVYGKYSAKYLTAINSGMAIRLEYLKEIFPGYNSRILFYGTDNDFMYKYSLANKFVFIMNAKIEHTLNYYEEKDLTLKFARYKDMKHGALVQMKDINRFLFWFCCFYYLCYEIKMSIKHRTLHLSKVVYH